MDSQLIDLIRIIAFLSPLVLFAVAIVWLVRIHRRGPSIASKAIWKPDVPWNKLNVDQGQKNGGAR
jgi:hypothetical protein